MCEMVKVEAEFPNRLFHAMDWYIKQTRFWICNDNAPKSYSEFIIYCVELQLEAEAENPNMARDFIKAEMKLLLDL